MAHLIASQIREKILRNYSGGDLRCEQLLEILEFKVQSKSLRARNELANRMATHSHFNKKAHNQNSQDKTNHYTVYINDKGHHLRLDAKGTVFQITDDTRSDLGSVPPWVPPGGR